MIMKEIAVIGANGFLGSSLTSFLLDNNYKVIAVYNNSTDNIDLRANLVSISSFLDSTYNLDYIYYTVGSYSSTHSDFISMNNTLYKVSIKYPDSKLIYISSTNVYGEHKDVINESSAFNNPNLYGLSKLAGEFIVQAHKHYSIIRFTYIYGRGITNNSFLPHIIKSAKDKRVINIYGEGERRQDYLHINDAVTLCYKSALLEQNTILLGASGVTFSNKEVAEIICDKINSSIEYSGIEKAPSFFFNPKGTFELTNWEPKVLFTNGIKEMLK